MKGSENLLRKLKEIYLSNDFLRFFIFSILVTLFVSLFKYVVFAEEIKDYTKINIHLSVQTTSDKLDKNLSYQLKSAEGRVFYLTLTYRYELGKSYTNVLTTTVLYSDYKFTLNSQEVVNTCNGPNGLRYFWYADGSLVGNKRGQKVVASNTQYYVDINEYNPNVYDNASVNQTVDSIIMNFLTSGIMDSKIIDLSKNEFDNNGQIIPKSALYDLEMPLNVTCKFHNKTFGNSYYNITWEQSDGLDIQGWETEIYISQHIKYGKYLWSLATSPHYYDTKYYLVDTVATFLGKYKKIWKSDVFYQGTKDELYSYVEKEKGYTPQITSVRKNNFMLRNKFVDKDGKTHYSDYVYLKEGEDGNYTASVIKAEETDKNGGITDIKYGEEDTKVDTNNDTYKNSDVSSSTTSFSGGVSTLKSLFSDLQELPKLIEEMFSFIPGQFIFALTAMLIVLIPIAILKLIK